MDSDVNCTPSTVNNHISPTWQSEFSEDKIDGKSHECLANQTSFCVNLVNIRSWQMQQKGDKKPGSKPGPIKKLCREERLVELEEELL